MTKSSKAGQDVLEALHAAVASELVKRIASGEATAADLNVARQFLKDNRIEAIPTPENPLGKLADSLPFPDAASAAAEDREFLN